MPIYEFYCAACNTVYSFFSSRVAPDAAPSCPGCGAPRLPRRPSTFATLRGGRTDEGAEAADDLPGPLGEIDEARLERAMEALESELPDAGGGADDPRAMAHFFRRFADLTGLQAGPRMEEMLARLEAGEDPDTLEEQLGGEGDEADLSDFFAVQRAARARPRRPKVDPTLHFL
jgi:putative FmdB family regulatory protein